MIYFIYDNDSNKYYGVYNNVTIMNNNLEFLKRENIVNNSIIFRLDYLHFEIKIENNPRDFKINEKNIYLLYDNSTNKFITYHASKLYLDNMITFFKKDYIIIKAVLNSMYIDLETNTNIAVNIEDNKKETILIKELCEEEKIELFEINREINILKQQQKRLQEKKEEFETHHKLYQHFKNEIIKNEKFIIPNLFENKFNIMKELEENNNLTFENFIEKNTNNFLDNSYQLMFKGGNNIRLTR
tara:strand:- start:140 stop:868 length:729 start_codon:yes stop_codon:yes gene_type:complete